MLELRGKPSSAKTGATLMLIQNYEHDQISSRLSAIALAALPPRSVSTSSEVAARAENQALRRKIAGLTADNQALSNRPQQTASWHHWRMINFANCLRLVVKSGMLRQQTNTLGKLRRKTAVSEPARKNRPRLN